MKKDDFIKFMVLFFILLLGNKSYSQSSNSVSPQAKLVLPDSYYKAIELKRKNSESNKKLAAASGTATTNSSNRFIKVEEVEDTPEQAAKKMLNTSEIPADFPKFKNGMSNREYEASVANWFKANPSLRKVNK